MCIVCGTGGAHLLRAIASSRAPRPGAGRFTARAVAPPVVPPLDPRSPADLAGPADTILRGAIVTMNAAATDAEAVAVRAGRIQAVGDAADVLAYRGRLTRVIDLDGRTLLPGFVNAHWHMPVALLCDLVDARAAPSPAAALDALALAVGDAPPGEWIVLAVGADAASRMSAMGEVSTHPVVVTAPDGTIVAGNARAAEGGALPAHVSALLPRFAAAPQPIRRRLSVLLRQTAATGVTCLRVCGLGTLAGADDLDLMRAAMDVAPPLRLRATLDTALMGEWDALRLTPGFGDDMFRVDTLSAWPGGATVAVPAAGGWVATIHAGDDSEVRSALEAFAACPGPRDARSGIECRRMQDPAQAAAIARLGLSLGLTSGGGGGGEPPGAAFDPAMPVSLGLDAASGPSAPLRMVAEASGFGLGRPDALAAVTIGAARRCGVGGILGSLERGKYADFAFLDGDPRTAADPARLRCSATWVNGREVFRA